MEKQEPIRRDVRIYQCRIKEDHDNISFWQHDENFYFERIDQVTSKALPRPNEYQVGGNHYQSTIQHWDYVLANEIPYMEAQIIKYVTRWRNKGGLDDLRKAKHFLEKLIEHEELKTTDVYTESALRRIAKEEEIIDTDRRPVYWDGGKRVYLLGDLDEEQQKQLQESIDALNGVTRDKDASEE